MPTEREIELWFQYHAPSPAQQEKYQVIRSRAKELALEILHNTPPGDDQLIALQNVREAVMVANQAIAVGGASAGTGR